MISWMETAERWPKLLACANERAAFLCMRKRTLEEARLSEDVALEAALKQQSGGGKCTVRNTDLEKTGEAGLEAQERALAYDDN